MSDALVGGAPATTPTSSSAGASPWALARRRLARNKVAMAMLGVLTVIVLLSLAAPLYADHIAHTDPFRSSLDGTTVVHGKTVPVMQPESGGLGLGVTPIGPTWDPEHYFLGADNQGRDVAARLLYGGRNSLLIGVCRSTPHMLPRHADRSRRGLLRRGRRRRAVASPRRRLGVPGVPVRDLPLDRPAHQQPRRWGRTRSRRGAWCCRS